MKQEDLQFLEKEILLLITKLDQEIDEMEDSAGPVSPENSIGRISRMDAINNKSVVEASLRHRRKKVSKLRIALSNIRKPGFGICVSCKKPINPKRLMLMPESDKCMRCA